MRVLKLIWWFPLAIYMIVSPSFVSDMVSSENCREIDINIKDSLQNAFVSRDMIFSRIHNEEKIRLGRPISEIDISEIESELRTINELSSVEVYSTIDGSIHVDADQRDAVVRIISSFGNSYYIDNTGVIIDHNPYYTPRVLVVSGEITVPDSAIKIGHVNELPETNRLMEVLKLTEAINNNELWSSQFEQLWIDKDGAVDLIPRVGNQVIRFGKAADYEKRLRNLEAFYQNAISNAGWNTYSEINLMYEGQIVCKRR